MIRKPSFAGWSTAVKSTGSTTPSIGSHTPMSRAVRIATVRSTRSRHRNVRPALVERHMPCGRAALAGRALEGMRVTAMSAADSANATAVAQNVAVEPTSPMRTPPRPGPMR